MNEKLKPCPFCHKMPRITNNMDYLSTIPFEYKYKINCSCVCDDYISVQASNLDFAIECWNDLVEEISEVMDNEQK